MPLPRNLTNCHVYERLELNVYDTTTKQVIFTGTASEVANKFKRKVCTVRNALKRKTLLCKKYAVRIKSTKQ